MPITETKNKIAIIGGTFDPVHLGHLHLFHHVDTHTDIEELVIIPALLSNFKQNSKPVSFQDRVRMLELAIEDYRDLFPESDLMLRVSDIEGRRGGVSYTADTIRAIFDEAEDNGKVNFIMGDDLLDGLERWYDYDYLKEHVRFYCFTRSGEMEYKGEAEVHLFDSPQFEASSTEVREGKEELLSRRVLEYIDENDLYIAI